MLRIDLRAVDEGPEEVSGTAEPTDPAFEGIDLILREPVRASGRVTAAGAGRYYWRGRVEASVVSDCRRCLGEVVVPIDTTVDLFFTEDADTEDPAEYAIPERAVELDLTGPIREELLLATPRFVLCKEGCLGLCPQCGNDLNVGACDCRPSADARWGALEALRDTLPDDEES